MRLRDRVVRAAQQWPNAVAVVDHTGPVTYAALDAWANQLAHQLAARGIEAGMRVGVWAEKSAAAVAGLQAVLRLGAVYVPLDPKSPVARIEAVAQQAELHAVLVDEHRPVLGALPRVLLGAGPLGPCEPVCVGSRADDELVYILFTSGSTGVPKGVCITERNVAAFVDWAVAMLDARPEDRFANHAPLHFDLSVLDLYAAFTVGACVCIVPSGLAYAPKRLVRFVHEQAITVWYSVPSALILMMQRGGLLDQATPALRAVLFAGEPFPAKHLRALMESRPEARFVNLYGPTETNVCTAFEVPPSWPADDAAPPIGGAASGDRVWAVDPDGEPVGVGEIGELWVEGPTVMYGYWGQSPHEGPYATGDLVRQRDDGAFVYVGRRDHMVKVRGHRVELGDVEAALLAHPQVTAACAVVRGEGVDARLVVFLVTLGDDRIGLLDVKRHCASRLPPYMIPGEVRQVSALPRTRNGKVDRGRLTRDGTAA